MRAHGRLGQVELHGGTRNASFGDHGVQHPDEMKLDLVEIGAQRHIAFSIPSIDILVYTGGRDALPLRHPTRCRYTPMQTRPIRFYSRGQLVTLPEADATRT